MLHMKIFIVLYPGRPSIEWNILNRGKEMVAMFLIYSNNIINTSSSTTVAFDKRKGALLIMDMKLEVLFIPVSDVDRAKRFPAANGT
jgi:hypothetical protein